MPDIVVYLEMMTNRLRSATIAAKDLSAAVEENPVTRDVARGDVTENAMELMGGGSGRNTGRSAGRSGSLDLSAVITEIEKKRLPR